MKRTPTAGLTKLFHPTKFTATKWEDATAKSTFAIHLIRFIESGCNPNLFYKALYTRLSMTFGHIAHFNKHGFYATWFFDAEAVARWKQHIKTHTIYGDPEYTYSDVERAIQAYARENW